MTDPLLLVKLTWVAAALLTFGGAVRLWWRMRAVQRSSAGRSAPERVRAWGAALVEVAAALALVALSNLAAGLVSLLGGPPWAAWVVALLIASALLKLAAVAALDRGYRRAVTP